MFAILCTADGSRIDVLKLTTRLSDATKVFKAKTHRANKALFSATHCYFVDSPEDTQTTLHDITGPLRHPAKSMWFTPTTKVKF